MKREGKHDFDFIGFGIGVSRMILVGCGAFISWWLATYFEPLQQSVQQLAINTAGINQKLDNLDTTTAKLEENQSNILLLVNSNASHIERNTESIKKMQDENKVVINDVNDLKIRVFYLEKK